MTDQATGDASDLVCPDCGATYSDEMQYCPKDGNTLVSAAEHGEEEDDPFIGTILGDRFRVDSILGEGGMGKVYRGQQLSVERPVAIKVIHSEHCDDNELVKRFFREAKVISQFSHPNIVNAIEFDAEAASGSLYFVMEYIDGYPLEELVDDYHLQPALALEIAKQTCEALSEPHEEGIVHRDIKPENLMLLSMSDGKVQTKVVDFGVAHALKDGDQNLTQTGMVYGTPYYMSPEQVKGGDVGPYTDTYALGIILYQMLGGTVPFSGEASTEIMLKHIQEEPAYLGELLPEGVEVPEEILETVHAMLRKDPEERLDDVLEIRGRIEEVEREYGLGPVRIDPAANADEMFEDWIQPAAEVDPTDFPSVEEIQVSESQAAAAIEESRQNSQSARASDEPTQQAPSPDGDVAVESYDSGPNFAVWGSVAAALFVGVAFGGYAAASLFSGDSSSESGGAEASEPSDRAAAPGANDESSGTSDPSSDAGEDRERASAGADTGMRADENTSETGESEDDGRAADETGSEQGASSEESGAETSEEAVAADESEADDERADDSSGGRNRGTGEAASGGSGESGGGNRAAGGDSETNASGGGGAGDESGSDDGEGEDLDLFTVD